MKGIIRKYGKAVLALVLSLIMVFEAWGGLGFSTKAADEPEVVSESETKATRAASVTISGGVSISEYSSNSTATNYTISSKAELKAFGELLKAGTTFSGQTIHLTQSIDFGNSSWSTLDYPSADETARFVGTFDGHNMTISNINTQRGFFTNTGESSSSRATIKNVVFENARVSNVYSTRAIVASHAKYTTISNVIISGCSLALNAGDRENVGMLVGEIETNVTVKNCSVVNSEITTEGKMKNVGLLIGSATTSAVQNSTVKDSKIISTYSSDSENSSSIGGAIGTSAGSLTLTDVMVEGVEINIASIMHAVGGMIGATTGYSAATCKTSTVKDVIITGTGRYTGNTDYATEDAVRFNHIGGFVGAVTSTNKATFEECFVEKADITLGGSYQWVGGLIGSTYGSAVSALGEQKNSHATINKCGASDITITVNIGRLGMDLGGLVGYLSEGSTVDNSYTYNLILQAPSTSSLSGNSRRLGGLIGYIPSVDATRGTTKVTNSWTMGVVLTTGVEYLSETVGKCETTNAVIENLWFADNCDVKTTTKRYTCDATKIERWKFEMGEVPYYLNNNTYTGSDDRGYAVWKQGSPHPMYATTEAEAPVKVIFDKVGSRTAVFTNADGTVDRFYEPDEGYEWDLIDGQPVTKNTVFTKNTWVTESFQTVKFPTNVSDWTTVDVKPAYAISTLAELKAFQAASNQINFEGVTIHLTADITWTSGTFGGIGYNKAFAGTFKGNDFTISNLVLNRGFFVTINGATISDLNIDNATCTAVGENRGLVVSRVRESSTNTITDVDVTNSKFTTTDVAADAQLGILVADGGTAAVQIYGCDISGTTLNLSAAKDVVVENVGIILGSENADTGLSYIEKCTVTDCHINGDVTARYRNIGLVAGLTEAGARIADCTVSNSDIILKTVKVSSNRSENIGALVGFATKTVENEEISVRGCVVDTVNVTLDGNVKGTSLFLGTTQGATIDDSTVKNSKLTINMPEGLETSANRAADPSEGIGGFVGLAGNASNSLNSRVAITGSTLENSGITTAQDANNIGGFIGWTYGATGGTSITDSQITITDDTVLINSTLNMGGTLGNGNAENYTIFTSNLGGMVGRGQAKIAAENVSVTGAKIRTADEAQAVGLGVGYLVNNSHTSTFNECRISGGEIYIYDNQEHGADDFWYVSGFAGRVDMATRITNTKVQNSVCKMRLRTLGLGGLIGVASKTVFVKGCEVSDWSVRTLPTTQRRVEYAGGIAGQIPQGSTIRSCLVKNVALSVCDNSSNTVAYTSDYLGGLIGNISAASGQTTIMNNFLYYVDINSAKSNVSYFVGAASASATTTKNFDNNYYHEVKLNADASGTAATDSGVVEMLSSLKTEHFNDPSAVYEGARIVTAATAKKAIVVQSLNTSNGRDAHDGCWAQGTDHPILALDGIAPLAYVTFRKSTAEVKFPIKADGTIDYTAGTAYVVCKDQEPITNVESRVSANNVYATLNMLNDENDGNGLGVATDIEGNDARALREYFCPVAYQAYPDYSSLPADVDPDGGAGYYQGEKYAKQTVNNAIYDEDDNGNPTFPHVDGGMIWVWPENRETFKAETMITETSKTAWDFDGNAELSVVDLLLSKKGEINGKHYYASPIGETATAGGYGDLAENQAYTSDSYLDAERMRRVILTPASREIKILNYNIYYGEDQNFTAGDNESEFLPDTEGGDTSASTRQSQIIDKIFNGDINADVITLQEVYKETWEEYLDGYVVNKEGESHKYTHVGRGRYHSKYSYLTGADGNPEDSTVYDSLKNDSFSLIIYDQTKYKAIRSGVYYMSDMPTVPTYGWEDVDTSIWDRERGTNWAILEDKKTGEQFMIVNVHFDNSEPDNGGPNTSKDRSATRLKAAEMITRKITDRLRMYYNTEITQGGVGVQSGGMPVIISGDYNSYYRQDAYKYVLSQNYNDPRTEFATSDNPLATFNSWTRLDKTTYSFGDHVLTNQFCDTLTYTVMDWTAQASDGVNKHLSDHCPMLLTMDVGTDYIKSTTSEREGGMTYMEWFGPAK